MEENTSQHSDVPDVVRAADVVEKAGAEALGRLAGVQTCTGDINKETLDEWGVEVLCPCDAASVGELAKGKEASECEGDVEQDAQPGHVGAVESWVPGEDDTADAEAGGQAHVCPARDGFAVEGGVLSGHDGCCDEERDAGVVDASEALEKCLMGDGVHGVPDS